MGCDKTACSERVTALEMENTHLRRELFELRGGEARGTARPLTEHERRVLDMWPRFEDGEPVMVGDAVALTIGNIAVGAIEFDCEGAHVKDAPNGDWNTSSRAAHRLKRPAPGAPDSWERLEEDAVKNACDYFGEECDSEWRCRHCPHFHEDRDCSLDMNEDIVRRAKRLAGIEVG